MMPGILFTQTHPNQQQEATCERNEVKRPKKKPNVLGCDLKTCLKAVLPLLEPHIRHVNPLKLPSDEQTLWLQSFGNLLESQYGLSAFRAFLKTEFSEENIQFWLACEDYKRTELSSELAFKAQRIYEEFIKTDSPREINIDFNTREAICKNILSPSHSCFDDAQKIIYNLMERDSYPRFLKSKFCLSLVENHQASDVQG
ncbi:regulator of G-protein signaling 21-like [Latimeria chalumnae]|uniref:RGS domain-containing protein n=1 Tax=Latimeria chalumnae TaxID=7897 RepID=H2ZWJ0_LATCH|nr:PREDICTED: regulator of G-protein signaling 21-like [Latimeria chalumnae]|eukprot:XP_006013984.1 PREDICTED: regulator of G-protein signaling 21-like [Latimeria chalumnae]